MLGRISFRGCTVRPSIRTLNPLWRGRKLLNTHFKYSGVSRLYRSLNSDSPAAVQVLVGSSFPNSKSQVLRSRCSISANNSIAATFSTSRRDNFTTLGRSFCRACSTSRKSISANKNFELTLLICVSFHASTYAANFPIPNCPIRGRLLTLFAARDFLETATLHRSRNPDSSIPQPSSTTHRESGDSE